MSMSQRTLDQELYTYITRRDATYDGTKQLLAKGANPNYCPGVEYYGSRRFKASGSPPPSDTSMTTALIAAANVAWNGDVARAFAECDAVDVNLSSSHDADSYDGTFIQTIMYAPRRKVSDSMLIALYCRITGPVPPKSELLFIAIDEERYDFARFLIRQHHAFHRVGYLHGCVYARVQEDGLECARLLVAEGYTLTGTYTWRPRLAPPTRPRTALEAAAHNCNNEMVELLVSFADISLLALDLLATSKLAHYVIPLMDRCDLRSLPSETHNKMLHVFENSLSVAIVKHHQGINPLEYLIQQRMHLPIMVERVIGVSPISCELAEFESPHVMCDLSVVVAVFLRQGVTPVEALMGDSCLRHAAKPWTERSTRLYFSREFRRVAFAFLLAIFIIDHDFMPKEMRDLLVSFLR